MPLQCTHQADDGTTHLSRIQDVLIAEDGRCPVRRRPGRLGRLQPLALNRSEPLQLDGKPLFTDTSSTLAATLPSRSRSFNPDASSGGRPASVRAERTAAPLPRTARASASARPSPCRSMGRLPRTRFLSCTLAWRSAPYTGVAASRRSWNWQSGCDTPSRAFGHRRADRVLTVGDDADNRDDWLIALALKGLLGLSVELAQVILARRKKASGQQNLAGKHIAEEPEDLVANIGLPAVAGQHDSPGRSGDPPQPRQVGPREGEQLVVAVQEVGHMARADRHAAADEFGVVPRDAAVLGRAERIPIKAMTSSPNSDLGRSMAPSGSGRTGTPSCVTPCKMTTVRRFLSAVQRGRSQLGQRRVEVVSFRSRVG